jgi:hypothetical protein
MSLRLPTATTVTSKAAQVIREALAGVEERALWAGVEVGGGDKRCFLG